MRLKDKVAIVTGAGVGIGQAIALGAHKAMAYYHLAFAIVTSQPENIAGAQAAIRDALALNPKDPYIQSLAGRIAYLAKDYPSAVEHLHAALEIWPDMVEAHSRLSATYRTMGDENKAREELKEVARIRQGHPGFRPSPSRQTNCCSAWTRRAHRSGAACI